MITVIAGINGAGKSSVIGSAIRARGGEYFNPDEHTRKLKKKYPYIPLPMANAQAWEKGFNALKEAVDNDTPYTFETTLGGQSVTNELLRAVDKGVPVTVIYTGLDSPERHIERVADRVKNGGHNIPEKKIRQRFKHSHLNLTRLVAAGADVVVHDNSAPLKNGSPQPKTLFRIQGKVLSISPSMPMSEWAKPAAAEAIKRNKS